MKLYIAVIFNISAALKKQTTIKDKGENGVSVPVEEKLVKPSAAKQADQASKPADEKPRFTKSALKSALKSEDKAANDKAPEKPTLRSVRTIDDKAKEKSVTIVDRRPEKNGTTKANSSVNDKSSLSSKDAKPVTKVLNDKPVPKTVEKPAPKAPEKVVIKPISSEKAETKPTPAKSDAKPISTEKATEDKVMATKPPLEKTPSKVRMFNIIY